MEPNRGFTLWFTGMIGSGKSALARYVAKRMPLIGRKVELLDHSELQDVLPEAWDASKEVRERNVKHLGWMARLLSKHDVVAIVAATSPDREVRDEQRRRIGRFAEVFVDCPFETLQERDEQGVYRKALAGEIQNVVGIQAPYEPPINPETRVDTSHGSVEELAHPIFFSLFQHGFISAQERDILINGMGDARLAVVRASAAKAGAGKAPKKAAAKKAAPAGAPAPKAPAKAAPTPGKAAKPKATGEAKKAASAEAKAKAKAPSKTAAVKAPAKKPAKAAARPAAAKKAVAAEAPKASDANRKAKPAAKTMKAAKAAGAGKTAKAAAKPQKAAPVSKKVAVAKAPAAPSKKGSVEAKAKPAKVSRGSPRSASA